MTYEEVYMNCNNIEELRVMVVNDLVIAKMINPDRFGSIKDAAEKVANLKFNETVI